MSVVITPGSGAYQLNDLTCPSLVVLIGGWGSMRMPTSWGDCRHRMRCSTPCAGNYYAWREIIVLESTDTRYYLFLVFFSVFSTPVSFLPPPPDPNHILGTRHDSGPFLGTARLQNYFKDLTYQMGKRFGKIEADLSWKRRGDKFTLWLVVTSFSAHSHQGSLI